MYSYEERMEAVKAYIDCNFSFAVVKRKLGYPKQYTSLRGWYEEYAATSELKSSMTREKRYSKEQRQHA
ncbi:MAG: IS3 family transposase, partial [Lachnospiraceae bacterium]|nr:IS3 family transposase [Lachnospiraceae bacterium]